ncbi:hypothetical protein [Pseudofrankia inefficax]|uniref:Putative ABC transporter permease n=1 Tax=Pseudofrankia inefficax (strain DSM 45817 / CECT 9037 / DDB 130130 / EuI1c) TaxID=298654 RepID=E3IYU5_PSEI1|nr:hypothetical protein [Pseudofrankia inefficax]ADP79083.1 putative ABC transporter permease [Pseudofrankia inefficax]
MTTRRTITNVAQYHLVNRLVYLGMPWAIVGFSFVVNLVVSTQVDGVRTGGLGAIFIYVLVCGLYSTTASLPFGLALGVSRRSYYLGTICLWAAIAAADGAAITALQAIERATGGWGGHLYFFRIADILDGPWYITWLTSFVSIAMLFAYGMWFGIVFRRWSILGSLAFGAAQVTVAVVAILVVTWTHAWAGVGDFLTSADALGLTAILAVLAAALLAGGFSTIRRTTV